MTNPERRLTLLELAAGDNTLSRWPDEKLEDRMTELAERCGLADVLAEARADHTGDKRRAMIASLRESINARA